MIEIGHLRLQLPPGFEKRGENIARLLGDALTATQVAESSSIGQLSIGPLHIDPHQSNAAVARQIASAIGRQLGSRGE